MKNPIKQLVGETVIYGLSTILARIINFIFVPFYTRLLSTESYGVVTEFMAYIAVFQVVLVLGLETGCFKFANLKGVDSKRVYSNAFWAVSSLGLAFLTLILSFSDGIANILGYDTYGVVVRYVGAILFMDAITAILFAKLRQEHKALKFAVFKTIKIVTELGANIVLFLSFPKFTGVIKTFLLNFIPATPDFSYVIFAIFISCIVCTVLFIPSLFKFKLILDKALLKSMLAYSLPLMIAALPGVINDFADRILFRFFDTNTLEWRSNLGIFQAAVKLSVIMSLFIQMFRFAAEPFFFQRSEEKGSKELYAKVMNYFTAFCGLVFLGIILYIDIISLILGKDFRVGVGIVPIMLLSYMLLGMLFNVSMWYKLSGKTGIAIYITLSGLAVTILVNVIFMPIYSYWAAAAGHLLSYLVMFVICAYLGQKYYPIPYNWAKLSGIMIVMLSIYGLSMFIDSQCFPTTDFINASFSSNIPMLLVHSALILVYLALVYFILRCTSKNSHRLRSTDLSTF